MPRDAHLDETPNLERALGRLRSSLVALVLLHGAGTILVACAVWIGFAFLADWGLSVPRPVRLFHAGVLGALPLFFLWRDVLRPLARIPDRAGLAVLLERPDPDLHELLVSAAELQGNAPADPDSRELARSVFRAAEERAAAVDLGRVLDRRAPLLRLTAGLAAAGLVAALFATSPLHARIFAKRMLGADVDWPRRTTLVVEVPGLADVEERADGIVARVARGTDVPVVVRAEGVAPDDVTLHFSNGSQDVLARGGGDTYRRVLRSLQADVEFWVTGGDDDDRDPLVWLRVLQPPDVAGLAVRVEPPAYTGLEPELVFDRDVEVLSGSRVAVHVKVDPPEARGIARVLPADLELELEPGPYPTDPMATPESPGAPPEPGLSFELVPDRSVRYRFELRDDDGLENPDPGLFAIHVRDDRVPQIRMLAPGRSDVETIAGGAIPLRLRVSDDFGLRELAWTTTDARDERIAGAGLDWRPLEPSVDAPEVSGSGSSEGRLAISTRRMSVDELFGGEVGEGSQCTLEVVARDNREPTAGEGRSSPVRVRIVSADELLRRVQDRLARVRLQASELSELQTEKWRRTDELLDVLATDDLAEARDGSALSSVVNGQRRVRGDAESVARELAAIATSVLYARLDEKAGAILERLDARMSEVTERAFRSEVWTELVEEYESGSLGQAGLAGNLIEILGVALAISEDHARAAEDALERARAAIDVAGVRDALEEGSAEQALAMARIEDLLERLAEWDSFQSVLSLTRDLLNRQKALRQRTKRFASEK